MSVASPPRMPGGRSDDDQDEDFDRDRKQQSPMGWIAQSWASLKLPFRLTDGSGRLRVALIVALIVMSLFVARLIDLQTVQSDGLAATAQSSRTIKVTLPAERGTIYDVNNVPLAASVPARDVTVDQTLVVDPAGAAARLAPILKLSPESIQKSLTGTKRFAYVARAVTLDQWAQVQALQQSKDTAVPGVLSERTSIRDYPGKTLAGNLLGFVNVDGEGKSGLEYQFDKELAGNSGYRVLERSATGGQIPTGSEKQVDPTQGKSYKLTINRDLQWVAQKTMLDAVKAYAADSGMVIIEEPSTGRILAMASVPTADPGDPNRDPLLLRNRAVQDVFEPGSTAKVMTMSGVLNEHAADPLTVIPDPNTLERGGTTFHDDISHGFLSLTLTGALARSSNIATIQAAEKIGEDKLYGYLKSFGVAQPSGLGFPFETPGYLPPVKDWTSTSFPTIAFGQGFSMNAMQVAEVFSTIANGGVRVQPQIIDSVISPDGSVTRPPAPTAQRVMTPETTKTLIQMMEEVVTMNGTAPQAAIPGYRVAGKTGTAFRIDDGCHCYKGYTSSFIGLAPADNPKLVVLAIMENPKKEHFGSVTDGPVFKTVMTAALQSLQIPPSGSKAVLLPTFAKGTAKQKKYTQ